MIGVYGGTFDPVHYGHLRPALEILEAFELSQIRFIPCGQPPHREPPHASAAQRLAMLHLAIWPMPTACAATGMRVKSSVPARRT